MLRGRDKNAKRRAFRRACLILAPVALPAMAHASGPSVITTSQPAGFSELTRDQTLMVDVYFGGVYRGEANVRVSPGSLIFLDPRALLQLLPDAAGNTTLVSFLKDRPLPSNAELACAKEADQSACGRLSPDTAGVIFDRDHFRVDLFLNPRFLSVHEDLAEKYLPTPGGGLSAVNAIGALYSGQSGIGRDYYNLFDHLIVGDGDKRLRADLSVATDLGFEAETLALEWDRPEVRYSAGALWTRGNDIYGRRKLIGGGISTQIDTRLDKDTVYGNPIVLYLDRRARVDVLRDGHILSSAVYDAGNQQIDTSGMPDGSYDIVLRIQEAGQPAREERRFYSKSQRVPSLGRTDFYAYGGVLVQGDTTGSLDPSGHPYFEGGVSHRLGKHWAIEGNVEATDHTAAGEAGVTLVTPIALLRVAALADTAGTVGGLVQLSSTGNSPLNFNFDLRKVDTGRTLPDALPRPVPLSQSALGSPYLDQFLTSYSQVSGYVAYSVATFRMSVSGIYRDDPFGGARYSFGPTIEWDAVRKGSYRLTFHGDVAGTERGTTGYAGVTFELRRGAFVATAQGGGRASSIAHDDLGQGAVGSIDASIEMVAASGDLRFGGGYQHQPQQDDVILSSEFRHPYATFNGDFVRSHTDQADVSQYTLAFQTTVTAGGGAVHVAGRTTTESLIVAGVDGARPNDRFEVLVNEQPAGTIEGTHTLSVELPSYREYRVRIRPVSEDLLAYDSATRTIGLYPGVVSKLRWTSSPVTMKFGRLVGPDGRPVDNASITGKGVWSQTDDQGNFQIEAPDKARLTVTTKDGRSFELALPSTETGPDIAQLGPIPCCRVEQIQLGALDRVIESHKMESQ